MFVRGVAALCVLVLFAYAADGIHLRHGVPSLAAMVIVAVVVTLVTAAVKSTEGTEER